MSAPQIQHTLDYDKFRTIAGNREVDQPHVRRLAEEIALNDLTPYSPVLVNETWEIIDGQHRFEVCKSLNLPVYYLQVPGLDLTSVQRINTSSKRWSLRITSIHTFRRAIPSMKYSYGSANVPVSTSVCRRRYLMGMESVGGASDGNSSAQRVGTIIREGRFKVSSRTHAEDMAILLKQLKQFADFDPTKERPLVFALNRVSKLERFDADRLIGKLRDRGLKLDHQPNTRYYLIELERIYNHGAQIRVDLFNGEEVRS